MFRLECRSGINPLCWADGFLQIGGTFFSPNPPFFPLSGNASRGETCARYFLAKEFIFVARMFFPAMRSVGNSQTRPTAMKRGYFTGKAMHMKNINHLAPAALLAVATAFFMMGNHVVHSKGKGQDSKSLNEKVLGFARSKLGKKVGDGQCWALADQALKYAGAQRPGTNGLKSNQFGNPVPLDKVIPGDVLQFMNIKIAAPNAFWSFPVHTAIVNKKQGSRIELIHQNYNGTQKVGRQWIDLSFRRPGGTLTAFRPR